MGIKDLFSRNKSFDKDVDSFSFDFVDPPFDCIEFDSKMDAERKATAQKDEDSAGASLPKQNLGTIPAESSTVQPDKDSAENKASGEEKGVPRGNYKPEKNEYKLPSTFDYTYGGPDYVYDSHYPQSYKQNLDVNRRVKIFSKPKPPINVIFLVIENTDKVGMYKDEVLSLAKRLIESNKNALFLLMQNGNDAWYSELLDFEDISSEKLFDKLLISDENSEYTADLMDAIKKINSFFKEKQPNYELKFKDKDYKISDASILFIGTGASSVNTAELKASFADHMKTLIQTPKVKSIKYFCMEDADTINAAALGFPVIGHIVSDFYKQGGK